MYFAIQVQTNHELETAEKIKKSLFDGEIIQEVFVPIKQRYKKFHGSWNLTQDICFSGYIFVKSNMPNTVAVKLRNIDDFTKLIGFTNKNSELVQFIPLSEDEERFLLSLVGEDRHYIEVSKVEIKNGGVSKVISGPLLNFKKNILKVDLHHRYVTICEDIITKDNLFTLGIEIVSASGGLENLDLFY